MATGLPNDGQSAHNKSFIFVGSVVAQRMGVFDSSGIQIDSFGGGTQYAIDTAAGATDTGTLSLAIRDDTLTTLTPVDGDYTGLRVNSTGALHVTGGGGGVQYAEDAAHVSGDTGTMMLGVYRDDKTGISADTVEDYTVPHIDSKGRMRVSPGGQHLFDSFVSTTGWAAFNNDTINLTTSLNHVASTGSLSFDKANGAANTVFAIIEKTITSISLTNLGTGSLFLQAVVNIPTLTDTVNVVIRVGTDSTNYNEWKIPTTDADAGVWEVYRALIGNSTGSTGNGWDLTAITYIAVGVEFSGIFFLFLC